MKYRATISVYIMSIFGEYLGSQEEDRKALRKEYPKNRYYYLVKYLDSKTTKMVPGDDSGPYGPTYGCEILMYATYEFGVYTVSKEPITQQQMDERVERDLEFDGDVQVKEKTTKRVSFE
jgi:hypothetical protein